MKSFEEKKQFEDASLEEIASWYNEATPGTTITVDDSVKDVKVSGVLDPETPEALARMIAAHPRYRVIRRQNGFTITLAAH